jgi:Tfp pilus assembly protein PilV
LIELLVASLLLCIGLMGLVNTWAFSFRVTQNTDNRGTAYVLARQALERVKMSGFNGTAEGTTTAYYNGNQETAAAAAAYFTVTTSVVSDSVQSGTAGVAGAVPAPEALRTATVTVKLSSSGLALFTTSTYLVRAGI